MIYSGSRLGDWCTINACDLQSWCTLLAAAGIPVIDHLSGEDGVEGESSDEAVQNEWVVDFLYGREDAGERSGEEVEDLYIISFCPRWV